MHECAICHHRSPRWVGALCDPCAQALARSETHTPAVVRSTISDHVAVAWLIDPWGLPHAVAPNTLISREPGPDRLVIADATISRQHARLEGPDPWTVRDLGSEHGTFVGAETERPLDRREVIRNRSRVRFSTIGFYLHLAPERPEVESVPEIRTTPASLGAYKLSDGKGADIEVLPTRGKPPGKETGYLRYRSRPDVEPQTVKLPRLQFQLLRALAERSLRVSRDSLVTRFLPSAELVECCGFASEGSLRQAVSDVRAKLERLEVPGARELIDSEQHFGYQLTWSVAPLR